jgi:hypothetical protein
MRTRHELREEEAQRERGGEEGLTLMVKGMGDGRRALRQLERGVVAVGGRPSDCGRVLIAIEGIHSNDRGSCAVR